MVQLVGTANLGDGFSISAPGMSGEARLHHAGAGAVRVDLGVPAGCPGALEAAPAGACAGVRSVEIAGPGDLIGRVTNAVAGPGAAGATRLSADILGGLVAVAKLVAGGAVSRPGPLPTCPAAPAPGDVFEELTPVPA